MNRQLFTTTLIAVIAMIAGCVAVPIAVPEDKPFSDVIEESFVPGLTSAQEVSSELGEPDLREPHLWVYHGERAGWRWAGCAAVPGGGSCGVTERTSKDFYLVIDFDDSEVVAAIDLVTRDTLCATRHICYAGSILAQAATVAEDGRAKSFPEPDDGCLVYTYSATSSASGQVTVDGEKIGNLVGDSGFVMHKVAPGRHAWIVTPPRNAPPAGKIGGMQINCRGPEFLFLRYSKGLVNFSLDVVDADFGKEQVAARWLVRPSESEGGGRRSNWLRNGEIFVSVKGASIAAFHFDGNGSLSRWGLSTDGERCGTRAALEDFGFLPMGNVSDLLLRKSAIRLVTLEALCGDPSTCSLPSVIDGEVCTVQPEETIEFNPDYWLLVLEARTDGYTVLYNDVGKRLRKFADCKGFFPVQYDCRLDTDNLHALVQGRKTD